MNRPKLLGVAIGVWVALEILAFALVVETTGLFIAMALTLGTTLLGLADVKGLPAALVAWRVRVKAGDGAGLDGLLNAFGSLLLVLPGFISDIAGLALKSPSIRAGLAQRIRERDRAQGPQIIDLAPNEWKNRPTKKRAPRRAPAK